MEWIPIDRENLPQGGVVAAVIKDSIIVGEITFGRLVIRNGVVLCDDRISWVFLPTHYFDPATLKIPQNKSLD